MREFHLFVLQDLSPQSHAYVGDFPFKIRDTPAGPMESLEEVVRGHIWSLQGFKSWDESSIDSIDFVVRKPTGTGPSELLTMAHEGELEGCEVVLAANLEALGDSLGLIFVFKSLLFRFALFRTIGSSHRCLTVEAATTPIGEALNVLKRAAQGCIEARLGSSIGADIRVWDPHQTFNPGDKMTSRSKKRLNELVSEEYIREDCSELQPHHALEDINNPQHLIITFTLQFGYAVFEKGSSPYTFVGSGELEVPSEYPIKAIEQAAAELAKQTILSESNPTVELSLDHIYVYEPKSSSVDAYDKTLQEIQDLVLDDGTLTRGKGLATLLRSGDPYKRISRRNLIVAVDVTKRRKVQFTYALFERKSGPFQPVLCGSVDVTSDQNAQVIWDAVRGDIKSHTEYSANTGHHIWVYQPRETFVAVYNKTTTDLLLQRIEEQDFQVSSNKVIEYNARVGLENLNSGQPLIVVFDLPSRPSLTLVDEFRRMRITIDAPSSVSKPENYQAIQKQTRERILDDRPEADHFIPPISLLYDGFGVFDDVIQERSPVDGEDDILGIALWDEVNAFANRMAGFYATEADRRSVVHDHLDRIFRARRDPQAAGDSIRASRIGSGQIISDGHSNGAHGAMVICIECKNELSGISCEPLAELVSYVARSFKEQMNGKHQALFQGWRVPALGMTMIGSFVQFFGIVMLAPQMRVVPLTPMLPLATPINDEQARRRLFLAFKAASIVLAKIRGDVSKHVQKTPQAIPLRSRGLPSVTGIKAVSSPSSRIDFTLLGRYDSSSEYRNLYHARQLDPMKDIYVKFTQRYSIELHRFCEKEGLAPKLLGFEQLPGGWFALAMEKVDVVGVMDLDLVSFSQLDLWKEDIGNLVKDFHRMDLVHGDLRLANFIFTKSSPPRMLLVDFDWGGEAEKVYFPRGELAVELHPPGGQDERLDRPITKDDDNRVLAGTFKLLDGLAAQKT